MDWQGGFQKQHDRESESQMVGVVRCWPPVRNIYIGVNLHVSLNTLATRRIPIIIDRCSTHIDLVGIHKVIVL